MSVDVGVLVERAGTGSVSVTLVFRRSTAAEIEDLHPGLLPVADLRRAGWSVTGPGPGPGGTVVVRAEHNFAALNEIPVLMADIAGSGPISGRPFRLSVQEQKGLLRDRFIAKGTVDLACALSCFDDPALRARLGLPLGIPSAQLAKLLGSDPGKELAFSLELALPGSAKSQNGGHRSAKKLEWEPALGSVTAVDATSDVTNVAFVRALLIAVGAGAVIVVLTAGLLVSRRRRRSDARSTGESGDPAPPKRSRPRARHSPL